MESGLEQDLQQELLPQNTAIEITKKKKKEERKPTHLSRLGLL